MGTWDSGLFSDDLACDIRDRYRELLEEGADDAAATRLTLEKYHAAIEDARGVPIIALAVTQSQFGRLDPAIRDRALAILASGADLDVWQEENPSQVAKRRAALDKARARLEGPQPARKRVKPPKRVTSGLASGDVLALALPNRLALLRVVRVQTHRLGDAPILEELDFAGTEAPSPEALERLGPRKVAPIITPSPLASNARFFALIAADKIDWQQAGFAKIQTITARAGDEQATMPDAGISWTQLAERYRRRPA